MADRAMWFFAKPIEHADLAGDNDGTNPISSPLAIWELVFHNPWLFGSFLAVLSSALGALGLVLQKKAQYRLMGPNIGPHDKIPSWSAMLNKEGKVFFAGFFIYILSNPLSSYASRFAPDETLVKLQVVVLAFNLMFAYGFLYERFSKFDIIGSILCVIGVVMMGVSLFHATPGGVATMNAATIEKLVLDEVLDIRFASYIVSWLAIVIIILYAVSRVSVQNVATPIAMPLLCGLMYGGFHLVARITVTLMNAGVWDAFTYKMITFTMLLYILSLMTTCEGVRRLSCRFFVPAFVVVIQMVVVFEDFLFFYDWDHMQGPAVLTFAAGGVVSLLSLYLISAERRVLSSPDRGPASPLLADNDNAIKNHRDVIAIIDEYRCRIPEAANPAPLKVFPMNSIGSNNTVMPLEFCSLWRFVPIIISVAVPGIPAFLMYLGQHFAAFAICTAFAVYQAWKMSAFLALFAYVGLKKVKHHEHTDFAALYKAEMASDNPPKVGMKYEEVSHFVILAAYKEDVPVLRIAIDSIAAQGNAKQIGVVLAMEERENREFKQGKCDMSATEKADGLISEYQHKFAHVLATYHPENLPGDVPGKSANTKWAANEILKMLPSLGLKKENVVLTVGDADSEFHNEYFPALTYFYVNAGGGEGETPTRFLTIWQAPIMHFKNYVTQPAIVRLASMVTTEHELSNLSDPNATKVAYSTYSISAILAEAVKGWDPEWISEDWHMSLKIFLATGGRLQLTPIFLPIMNYTPESDTFMSTLKARWEQGKRHALGFSEIVYFHGHFFRILTQIDSSWGKAVFLWRSWFIWSKLLMIHVFIADVLFVGVLNGMLLNYYLQYEDVASVDIGSWIFLINATSQLIAFLAFLCAFCISAQIFDTMEARIDDAQKAKKESIFWRSTFLHIASIAVQCLILLVPVIFVLGGTCEWIAAFKTAQSTKFTYVTAAEGARAAASGLKCPCLGGATTDSEKGKQ